MDRAERIDAILKYMVSHKGPCNVTEMSKELKIGVSSVCRVLQSLEKLHWLEQLATDEYVLGGELLAISLSVVSGIDLRKTSYPYMHELNVVTNETVALVKREGIEEICIEQIESSNPVRHVLRLGGRVPLCAGAAGRSILSYLAESEIEEVINEQLKRGGLSEGSVKKKSVKELRAELAEIRQLGYKLSVGERTSDTVAIASPIFDRSDKPVGAILITLPIIRFEENTAKNYCARVMQAASEISIKLGANPLRNEQFALPRTTAQQ